VDWWKGGFLRTVFDLGRKEIEMFHALGIHIRAYFGLDESGGFSREFGWASLWRSIRYFGDDRCRSPILWTCASGW
jgi:hypothetical protein